ncbi:MAG TPA: glycosyltransferase family 4 protein [Opitutaceae bacterium]|nr:glycosyltransferase family 4 protein [Opitutaceae bacterium]
MAEAAFGLNGEPARSKRRVAFLVQRIGPYHHARLARLAASQSWCVTAVEFRPADSVYAWADVPADGAYERRQTRSARELRAALEQVGPEAVVCVGYSDPEIHQAMTWAVRRGLPLVTCSDSTYEDESRSWVKETSKRLVVAPFAAALVAGSRAHAYLGRLGISRDRRFEPWDVVDNLHFERGAEASRGEADAMRARYRLPPRYFLCVARFVPKKNLRRLIEAYAGYAAMAGSAAWSLVLSGDGPEEARLRADVAALKLEAQVHFPGFLQYSDLPAAYGLAGAFVLPSISDQWGLVVNEAMAAGLPVLVSARCGCAPELVREGENGFTFDPENTGQLAGLMAELAGRDEAQRAAMGRRSREIVSAFSPETFARGLEAALARACGFPRTRTSFLTRLSIHLLAGRSPHPA